MKTLRYAELIKAILHLVQPTLWVLMNNLDEDQNVAARLNQMERYGWPTVDSQIGVVRDRKSELLPLKH